MLSGMTSPPFHLAFPVRDIASTRRFYGDVLGCEEGRSADRWIDYDFFGHQLSAHVTPSAERAGTNPVDGDEVPIPHFGVVLDLATFDTVLERLRAADVGFLIGPRTRFEGEPGEQSTMFVQDPSGNVLEFKAFGERESLFRS